MTSTSSKRAAPPKRLSLTPGRSFQLSSPPPPRSAGTAVASSSFTSSPVQSHHRHSLHRASSISYTTNSNSRTFQRQFEQHDHPPHSASEAATTTVTGTVVVAATEPLTLADRHSTLLFQIAEKESKCLELRTQLLQHERELAALKQRWERVLVASSSTSNVSHAAKSMSMSISSAREPVASITNTTTARHSISEESTSSSSDSSPSVTTPSDEIPALSPSPARIALPGTLGLSMMYKELSAGIVKSDKLKRASLFLNDMLTSALTAPISAAPTGAPVTDSTASEHDISQPSMTTTSTAAAAAAKPSEPAVSRTECTPRRRSRDKKTLTLLDDDIEWSTTQSVPNPTPLTPDTYPRSSSKAVLQPVSSNSVNINPKSAPVPKPKKDKAQGPTDFDDDWNW